HSRFDQWPTELLLAIGFSRKGIDFGSLDGNLVYVVFMMASSSSEPYAILQTMTSIVRLMMDYSPTDGFSIEEIMKRISILNGRDAKIIMASDIMIPVKNVVHLNTPIENIAHMMHMNQLDVVPVIDDTNRYCGEISSLNIFKIGMPSFFNNLPTVSFVRHIDPFEKYFHIKGNLNAKDIMVSNTETFKKDGTLLEIIFELTVKNRQRIFILDDAGNLEGMIDRFCILDKILFF
ncbi:MAG: CBS domain-containing protein, partial [Candidatus Omnitrophica bacterium]|nr:CBS domain-containing protein [Candidatus Omnitrophota bacterium]